MQEIPRLIQLLVNSTFFADTTPVVLAREVSIEKFPSHHLSFVNRVGPTANIIGKRLLSLQPVITTRQHIKKNGLLKQQRYFGGHAVYGHEVLMS
jgi:hypothetical protein